MLRGFQPFMTKLRFVFSFLFVISLLLISVSPILAQGEPEPAGYKNVTIWVNPEYDDPRLLVMMEGKVDGVTPPATVRFLVPQAAEMFSAGSKNAFGEYSGGPPNRQASDIAFWDEISYVATDETFRMEYYDPVISEQPDRTFTYEFHPLYTVSALRIVIQQPRRATNFGVQAADNTTGQRQTDSEGFSVIAFNYPDVAAGSTLSFQVSYNKTDSKPSLQSSTTSGQSNPPGSSGASNSAELLWVGIPVVALLIAGILWALKGASPKRTPRRVRAKGQTARPQAQAKAGFCRKCGRPLKSGDQFCVNCGAKV